jgi:GT2 family glycosyltransferase
MHAGLVNRGAGSGRGRRVMDSSHGSLGVVVIGRNEGERLKRCLRSVKAQHDELIVYVDSGSSDDSVDFAFSLGVDVVDLDIARPFTMARGRNAGFERLMELVPETRFVQFIDGDCELAAGYLEVAKRTMHEQDDVTVVCGRRRERYPQASIYNRLCDLEWGREIGTIDKCGGDMMVRADIFRAVGMFDIAMIAGEEPELCVRIRQNGGTIVRIDHDMTFHDAAMMNFGQWWRRAMRGGHAYAEGAAKHGTTSARHNVRQVCSVLVWGLAVPIAGAISVVVSYVWPPTIAGAALCALGYLALGGRVARSLRRRGHIASDARLYGLFCVVAKFPGVLGMGQYWLNRLRGRSTGLIEYKADESSGNAETRDRTESAPPRSKAV